MPVRGYDSIDRGDINFCLSCGAELNRKDMIPAKSHGDDWVVKCPNCELGIITVSGGGYCVDEEDFETKRGNRS